MDFIQRVAGWYIGIFRFMAFLGFCFALTATLVGIMNLTGEETGRAVIVVLFAVPLWLLIFGNIAVFILMYQHLESIDSKRL